MTFTTKDDMEQLPEGIIFDFDGVILESTEIKTEAFLELFVGHPQHLDAIRRHHLENLGVSRFEKFAWIYNRLLGRELSAKRSEQLGQLFSELVLERTLRCPLVPGALESLQELRGNMPLFIASATPQGELEFIVERRGLTEYFAAVRGSPSGKARLIREILVSSGLQPGSVLMIGDGNSDYRAAMNNGVPFLAREVPGQEGQFGGMDLPQVADLRDLPRRLIAFATRAENHP